jgi:lipid-A-disaccharide synthase
MTWAVASYWTECIQPKINTDDIAKGADDAVTPSVPVRVHLWFQFLAMPLIYLVAGEASGDVLGARLMSALRSRRGDLTFAGIGGERMISQGLFSLFPIRELALMGLLEVLPHLRQLRQRLHQTAADIEKCRPDVVVTIDSPDFTLRVLRAIRGSKAKRVHYVAPHVWAWRESRVKRYPGLWDQLLCLLPFEPDFFARYDLPAVFVGHPVLESGANTGDGTRFRTRHDIDPAARVLTVMPGSRRTEVSRLLPILGATLRRLPDVLPVVPVATLVMDAVRTGTRNWPRQPILVTEERDKFDAFAASAAALTKSGTSSLELAMAGLPMVVTYRINPLSAAIARRLIKVRYASIVNLIAEREIIPELIQEACTPARLASAVQELLDDRDAAEAQRTACRSVLDMLRPDAGMPSESAAEAVLALLKQT